MAIAFFIVIIIVLYYSMDFILGIVMHFTQKAIGIFQKQTGVSNSTYERIMGIGVVLFAIAGIIIGISLNNIDTSNSEPKASHLCTYPSCNNEKYGLNDICFRHMCSEEGCFELATSNTMFTYCEYHEKELTCADPSCYQPKYFARGSDYCQTHYDDYE